jgi:hypothetical protein
MHTSVCAYICRSNLLTSHLSPLTPAPPPPTRYYANPQTGQIMFFYPQSGSQFVVEGFVIGFLNLGCAGCLALVALIAPKFKDEQNRTAGVVGGIVGFAFCFRMVRNLYIMKNQWYGKAY